MECHGRNFLFYRAGRDLQAESHLDLINIQDIFKKESVILLVPFFVWKS